MQRLTILIVISIGLAGPAVCAPLTDEQGEAILEELRAIRGLLERMERQGASAAAAPSRGAQIPVTARVSIEGRPSIGPSDAPLTLVEFTDYQCPFCRRFFETVYPELRRKYVDAGRLRIVVKDMPLPMHRDARGAAEAALCANEQDRYWEMHDELFENSRRLGEGRLRDLASRLGLDIDAFDRCLSSDRHLASIDADLREAQSQSITGTPTFVLGRTPQGSVLEGVRIRGAQPLRQFEQHIEALLAREPAG